MYTFSGDIRKVVGDRRADVTCRIESLSLQDFEKVGGQSARPGFVRTTPSSEKYWRPGRRPVISAEVSGEVVEVGVGERVVQGAGSSWAAMVSSMLASPPFILLAANSGKLRERGSHRELQRNKNVSAHSLVERMAEETVGKSPADFFGG